MTSEMTAIESSLARAYVGSSGFSYSAWQGGFYPTGSRESDFLALYAEQLPAVELNSTFYQLPSQETFERWAESTPAGFRFTLKMNRHVTLAGRLELLATFCEHARLLGDRLGPIRVEVVARATTGSCCCSSARWIQSSRAPRLPPPVWDDPGNRLLDEAGVVRAGALEAAAPFRYLRFRDPPYDEGARGLGGRIRPLLERGIDVYGYFRHEDEPTAPVYAALLRR